MKSFKILALFLVCIGINGIAFGQAKKSASNHRTILLWPNGAPGAKGTTPKDKPSITIFTPPASKANGTAVLICPGGGYAMEAMNKEGYKPAKWLNGLGVTAYVLKYRHGPRYQYPAPYWDAVRAMHIIRSRAKKWSIDPNRLGIMGFSAGGHLASTVGTHWKHSVPLKVDSLAHISSRPDFMILAYPVITMKNSFTHHGSRRMLLGTHPKPSLVNLLSNEDQVSQRTPPTFIVQGTNDHTVPVENSIAFYKALHAHHVPVEMHLFEKGPHGFGLAQNKPALSIWPKLCENWLRSHHLLSPKSR
ncbi:MAG TPA: alpha/beta hydrolase [Balneolaceae bacterium]|nr:alpha/beta hydrolase [Balneolaceae bacterium]